jgi:hypothetical protein
MAKQKLKPLRERPAKERYEARRILLDDSTGEPQVYDPSVHPASIVKYFKDKLEEIQDVERVETERGDVKHVQAPIPPPTLAGYAVSIGVTRECVWSWSKKHEEFEDAFNLAKAMQEQAFLTMGATGAYAPQVLIMMMKNLQGWTDRTEQTHKGAVTLLFDEQDKDA